MRTVPDEGESVMLSSTGSPVLVATHTSTLVAFSTVDVVPVGQALHAVGDSAPTVAEYVPIGQAFAVPDGVEPHQKPAGHQTHSADAGPAYWPGTHSSAPPLRQP